MTHIMAITRYGERLRDTDIAISTWESEADALAELREVFADDLAEDQEAGLVDVAAGDADTKKGLLDALRWYHNVIVAIVEE